MRKTAILLALVMLLTTTYPAYAYDVSGNDPATYDVSGGEEYFPEEVLPEESTEVISEIPDVSGEEIAEAIEVSDVTAGEEIEFTACDFDDAEPGTVYNAVGTASSWYGFDDNDYFLGCIFDTNPGKNINTSAGVTGRITIGESVYVYSNSINLSYDNDFKIGYTGENYTRIYADFGTYSMENLKKLFGDISFDTIKYEIVVTEGTSEVRYSHTEDINFIPVTTEAVLDVPTETFVRNADKEAAFTFNFTPFDDEYITAARLVYYSSNKSKSWEFELSPSFGWTYYDNVAFMGYADWIEAGEHVNNGYSLEKCDVKITPAMVDNRSGLFSLLIETNMGHTYRYADILNYTKTPTLTEARLVSPAEASRAGVSIDPKGDYAPLMVRIVSNNYAADLGDAKIYTADGRWLASLSNTRDAVKIPADREEYYIIPALRDNGNGFWNSPIEGSVECYMNCSSLTDYYIGGDIKKAKESSEKKEEQNYYFSYANSYSYEHLNILRDGYTVKRMKLSSKFCEGCSSVFICPYGYEEELAIKYNQSGECYVETELDFDEYTLTSPNGLSETGYWYGRDIKPVSSLRAPANAEWGIYTLDLWNDTPLFSGTADSTGKIRLTEEQKEQLLSSDEAYMLRTGDAYNGEYSLFIWDDDTYSVFFDLNGGKLNSDYSDYELPDFYYSETGLKLPVVDEENPILVRKGHKFMGWYTDAKLTKKATEIKPGTTGDKIFYAKWTPVKYKVQFVFDRAGVNEKAKYSGSMKTVSRVYGDKKTLPAIGFKVTGYALWAWEDVNRGIGYYDKSSSDIVAEDGETVVLRSVWYPVSYNITYHYNGAGRIDNPNSYTAYDWDTDLGIKDPIVNEKAATFEGWYLDAAFTKPFTGIRANTTGDIDLYAKVVLKSYEIRFDGNGATSGTMNPQTVKAQTLFNLNANKFKNTNALFAGWVERDPAGEGYDDYYYADKQSMSYGLHYPQTDPETGMVYYTLTAVWQDEFEVHYHIDGAVITDAEGEHNGWYTQTYTYKTGLKTLPTPEKEGYDFAGWYKDPSLKKKVTSISATSTGNIDLYPKFTGKKFTVTFLLYDMKDYIKMSPQTFTYGKPTALKAIPKVKGYTMYWMSNDTGIIYKDKQVINGADDLLKDHFASIVYLNLESHMNWYTITYANVPEGVTNNNWKAYSIGFVPNKLENPGEYPGYIFGGWYKDAAYKKKVTGITKGSTGDITLYAKWIKNYRIHYTAGDISVYGDNAVLTGASSEGYNQIVKNEKAYNLTANKYKLTVKDGGTFVFDGWKAYDGEAVPENYLGYFKDKAKINSLNPKSDVVTMVAVFTNTYAVTYAADGGTIEGMEADQGLYTDYFNVGVGIKKLPVPTKTGYTFVGWYSDAKLSKKVTSITNKQKAAITLYAKYKENTFKVVFDKNSRYGTKATGSTKPVTLSYKTAKALTKNGFKIKGYTFLGWSLDPNSENDYVDFTDREKVSGEMFDVSPDGGTIVLYAVWLTDHYSIYYEMNLPKSATDDSLNSWGTMYWSGDMPTVYDVNDTIYFSKEPYCTGYLFKGWYSDKKCTKKITKLSKGTTGNKTIYAKWVLIK